MAITNPTPAFTRHTEAGEPVPFVRHSGQAAAPVAEPEPEAPAPKKATAKKAE